jgi:Predicted permease
MTIIYNKIIKILVIINLFILSIILINKLTFIDELTGVIKNTFLIPIFASAFIYYLIYPLFKLLLNKGCNKIWAVTISILSFLAVFTLTCYLLVINIIPKIKLLIDEFNKDTHSNPYMSIIIKYVNNYFKYDDVFEYFSNYANDKSIDLVSNIWKVINLIISASSSLLLIFILVVFFMLDGHKFKNKLLNFTPDKYKKLLSPILTDSNSILQCYVLGQTKVALSLAIMLFIGYKIINMPYALIFSFITFILAFIPFIGFFISMILPFIIALCINFTLVIKLAVLFMIVQTLKGRVVVPLIMSNQMKIHPLTDIFLVVSAVAIGGPLAAFSIVPIYSVLKMCLIKYKQFKLL